MRSTVRWSWYISTYHYVIPVATMFGFNTYMPRAICITEYSGMHYFVLTCTHPRPTASYELSNRFLLIYPGDAYSDVIVFEKVHLHVTEPLYEYDRYRTVNTISYSIAQSLECLAVKRLAFKEMRVMKLHEIVSSEVILKVLGEMVVNPRKSEFIDYCEIFVRKIIPDTWGQRFNDDSVIWLSFSFFLLYRSRLYEISRNVTNFFLNLSRSCRNTEIGLGVLAEFFQQKVNMQVYAKLQDFFSERVIFEN